MSDFDDFENDSEEAQLEAELASKDPVVRATALRKKAVALIHVNHNDNIAPIYLEEAFTLFESSGSLGEAGICAYWLGWALANMKQFDRALEVHLKGAQYSRQVMDDDNELNNITCIALIYKRKKDHKNAAQYYGVAYELAKAQGSHSLPWIRNFYIRSLRKISNYSLAAELARAAIEEGRDSGEDFPIVMGDQELAAILMEQGDYQGALVAATEAYNLAVFVEQAREAERAQFNKAKALNLLGRHAEALEELSQMQSLKRYKSKNKHRLRVDFEIAKSHAGMGNLDSASAAFARVIPLFDAFKVTDTANEAMLHQAMNYMAMGNDLDAELVLGSLVARLDSVSSSSSSSSSSLAANASVLLGGIYESREAWQQVVDVYEPLDRDPTNRYSVWFPGVLQSLAVAYFRLGRLDDADSAAATVIATGLSVDPGLCLGDALAVRADVAFASGNVAAARRFGRKAIKAFVAAGLTASVAPLVAKYL